MGKLFHPTTDDLILFMDRELETDLMRQIELHLRGCAKCSVQLHRLVAGVGAYQEYHRVILQPSAELISPEWETIREQAAGHRARNWRWWGGAGLAAAAAVLLIFTRLPSETDKKETAEILAKAEASPQRDSGQLVFTTAGRRWLRTASSADAQHVHSLFVQAHYNWERPLSARSYAEWRNNLPKKQDQVLLVRDASGTKSAYRLRTRTEAGVLRTASLTLRADTYHPTNASFEFKGEELIDVSESLSAPPQENRPPGLVAPGPLPAPTETVVGPEEELRVLAALNAIGADAEEAVAVQLDAAHHHVVVTALGLPPSRQTTIAAAVADLPATVLRFSAAQPRKSAIPAADTYAAGSGSAFRRKLEEQVGGARQWQEITDRALDISSSLFARTHSLLLLAQEFGPNVEAALRPDSRETLHGLQQRQVGAIQYATQQLQQTLTSVMASDSSFSQEGSPENRPWQSGAVHLYEEAKILDGRLGRLLTGSYDEETGLRLQAELPRRLAIVEALLREQSSSRSK